MLLLSRLKYWMKPFTIYIIMFSKISFPKNSLKLIGVENSTSFISESGSQMAINGQESTEKQCTSFFPSDKISAKRNLAPFLLRPVLCALQSLQTPLLASCELVGTRHFRSGLNHPSLLLFPSECPRSYLPWSCQEAPLKKLARLLRALRACSKFYFIKFCFPASRLASRPNPLNETEIFLSPCGRW